MRRRDKKLESAWVYAFMAGKKCGRVEEQDRIVALLTNWQADKGYHANFTLTELIDYAVRRPNEED